MKKYVMIIAAAAMLAFGMISNNPLITSTAANLMGSQLDELP